MKRVTEGRVTIKVEDARDGASAGTSDAVFYNPEMELNRDVTVAVLRAFADRHDETDRDWIVESGDDSTTTDESTTDSESPTGAESARDDVGLSYLDAMTASGIRAARAAAAGYRVTGADVDGDAVGLARRNLPDDAEVAHRDVNALLHERRFDVVDVDPYGSPVPFADAAIRGTNELLAVTATDTAPLCGAHFPAGVRRYDTVPRNTEYHPEMGLRVLLSALVRTGARHDVALQPLTSHVSRHYARTYLTVDRSASRADDTLEELGYVHHCRHCLAREAVHGRFGTGDVSPPDDCPNCGADAVTTAGPLWLGSVADSDFTRAVRDRITDDMGTASRARDLLDRVASELDQPTHYDHHRLCEEWSRPASAMDDLIRQLRDAGFDASRAHYSGTAFKTTASVPEIRMATSE